MKRERFILAALVVIAVCCVVFYVKKAGTDSGKAQKESTQQNQEKKETTDGKMKTVTLPLSFFQLYDQEQISESLKEQGVEDITYDDANRTITFSVQEAVYQKMLSDQKEKVDKAIAEILTDKTTYPSYVDITYNDDVSQFDVSVNGDFDDEQSFGAQGLFAQGSDYQMLNGVGEEQINTTVRFINQDTGDTLYAADTASMGSEYTGQ